MGFILAAIYFLSLFKSTLNRRILYEEKKSDHYKYNVTT